MTDVDSPSSRPSRSDRVGRPADSVRMMDLDDELSVLDAATGTAFALNRTAADVLALADGSRSVDDIVDTLARAYQMAPMEIDADVRAVIGRLTEAGVLVAVG